MVLSMAPRSQAAQAGPTDVPVAVSFFAPFVIPKTIQDTYRLKEYVCSEEFAELRSAAGDPAAVDAIFARALTISWDNSGEALYLSLVATMEHRRVDITLPIVGLALPIPLTGEFEDEFSDRVQALPARLYDDSPRTPYGDRDKLQHFFGSAFLVLVTESEEGADEEGNFVERGESRYVIGEIVDTRDIRANRQGQRFGRALLAGESVRPSDFLRSAQVQP